MCLPWIYWNHSVQSPHTINSLARCEQCMYWKCGIYILVIHMVDISQASYLNEDLGITCTHVVISAC